jgi:hypothetical protein
MATSRWRSAAVVACLAVASTAGMLHAAEVPIVNGEHWTKSSDDLKKAYLVGVANVLQIEWAYQKANPPSDSQSLVPTAALGLKGQTLDGVRDLVDRWYAANPGRLDRPVFEVIWYEAVIPGYAKAALKKE